jgi:hypothetical protein
MLDHDTVVSFIMPVISVILTMIIGWAAALFQRVTFIKVEDSWRESIHSAAMTGITSALSRFGVQADDLKTSPNLKTQIIGEAANWIFRSVPDALKGLGLDKHPDKVAQLVESKIGLLGQTPGTIEAGKAVPHA